LVMLTLWLPGNAKFDQVLSSFLLDASPQPAFSVSRKHTLSLSLPSSDALSHALHLSRYLSSRCLVSRSPLSRSRVLLTFRVLSSRCLILHSALSHSRVLFSPFSLCRWLVGFLKVRPRFLFSVRLCVALLHCSLDFASVARHRLDFASSMSFFACAIQALTHFFLAHVL
jgi:hypothetical protein